MTAPAHLDWDRRRRIGISEAIWGQHKTAEQIATILESFHGCGEPALVTRVDAAKAAAVAALLPGHDLQWHHQARCLSSVPISLDGIDAAAPVTILSGGTSDLPVAKEAQLALAFQGIAASLMLDVGVAGLHRLLERLPLLRSAQVLIACAGMEGALPTVLAGLVPQPVIGVPVSVGYGVSAGGRAALDGMLASCAPGLTVVNIDNGYGAAMAALRILSCSTERVVADRGEE